MWQALNSSLCSCFIKRRKELYWWKKIVFILVCCPHACLALASLWYHHVSISWQNLYILNLSESCKQCFYTVIYERVAVHRHPLLGLEWERIKTVNLKMKLKKWNFSFLLNTDMIYWLFRNRKAMNILMHVLILKHIYRILMHLIRFKINSMLGLKISREVY